MIAYHLQPPPVQREGGLDAAIQGLCSALEQQGLTVRYQLPVRLEPGSVVHLHGLWQSRYRAAAAQCRAQEIPYLISPHGMLEPWAWRHKRWKKLPYFWLFERRLLRGAAAVLATAEEEAGRLRQRLPGARVKALPLGMTGAAGPDYLRARGKLGWSSGERVLLYLSRLHPKKGLEMLLQALAERAPGETLRLVVVGAGAPSYVRHLQALAAAQRTQLPPVEWVGPVWGEERWAYFQGADLFCLPTYSENFGLAVLEALQVGTPVLTTRTTPWGSSLQEPYGFISDPTATSVGEALSRALAHPRATVEERALLAEWTREHYSWSRLGVSYRALYQALTLR